MLVLSLVVMVGGVGFTASFGGLTAVAKWAMLDGLFSLTVPLIVDGSIIVFSLAAILKKSRGESTIFAWICVGIFTVISIAANSTHVLLEANVAVENGILKAIGGAFVAGIMPISIFLVTETVIGLLVEKPKLAPEDLRAQIDAETKEKRAREAEALAAAVAEDRRIQAQKKSEMEQEARRQRWDELVASDASSVAGTPERREFEDYVYETYREHGDNASQTAKILGISYPRARQAIHVASERRRPEEG